MSLEQENIAQFIIGIYIFDISENKWEYIEDGFAKIVPNSYGTTLLITNKEDIKHEDNKFYFDKIISESFTYESKESDNKDAVHNLPLHTISSRKDETIGWGGHSSY